MAAVLDLHALVILKTAWAALATDSVQYRTFFSSKLPNATADAWHAKLFPGAAVDAVLFQPAYNSAKPQVMQVTVDYAGDGAPDQPLGFRGQSSSTVEILASQRVVLTSHAPSHELVVALDAAVQGLVMANHAAFIDAGYTGLTYEGGGAIVPEQKIIMPDAFGAFARTRTWSTRVEESAAVTSGLKTQPIHLYAADVTVSGEAGGVTPSI